MVTAIIRNQGYVQVENRVSECVWSAEIALVFYMRTLPEASSFPEVLRLQHMVKKPDANQLVQGVHAAWIPAGRASLAPLAR